MIASRSIAILLFISATAAGDSAYFIGNSLTWDSQPNGIAALAGDQGGQLTVGYHIRCSSSLETIAANPTDVCVTPVAAFGVYGDALPGHHWDAVTIQPFPSQGSTMIDDLGVILDMIGLTRTGPGNTSTTFYLYQSWPGKGDYQTRWDQAVVDADDTPTTAARQYYDHLIERVRAATDATVYMIPVAEVLYEMDVRLRAGELPGYGSADDLYRDNTHMRLDIGRFTAGLTTYSVLTGTDPDGITRPDGFYVEPNPALAVDLDDATYQFIWSTVRDVVNASPYVAHPVPEPGTLVLIALAAGAAPFRRRNR